KVETGEMTIAGARLAVTVYTFRVSESFKGSAGRLLTFRQVGVPEGGAADLGRRAGLPVYSQGGDYLLFLLPESRAGLTSPAGAAQGAFAIDGDEAKPLGGMPVELSAPSYQSLRGQVVKALGR